MLKERVGHQWFKQQNEVGKSWKKLEKVGKSELKKRKVEPSFDEHQVE